jgi:starch synthase
MNVLFVASECAPFVKTGGLADVIGAVPKALGKLGVSVKVLLPCYPALSSYRNSGSVVASFDNFFEGSARLVAVQAEGLDLLLLDAPHLFDRPGNLYVTDDQVDWPDNHLRFGALSWMGSHIGLQGIDSWHPDVVNAHDWQAGLVAAYLKQASPYTPPVVLTIHNIAFQGLFPKSVLPQLGLDAALFNPDGVEYYDQLGFLKGGIKLANHVTTVSPTYAQELLTEEYGMGLEGLLRSRQAELTGVINGIDLDTWNPETDPHIAQHYSIANLADKYVNHTAVRARFGLSDTATGPLFCVVSRLTNQKGLDLLLACLPTLVSSGAQLALLGSGEPALERAFEAAAQQYRGSVGVIIGYDEPLSHLMQAGSDAILIPSRFEPCGLTQLYGLRYGTLPVVARTGGLADTVIDANEAAMVNACATGFQFTPGTVASLDQAILRVAKLFGDKASWNKIVSQAMQQNVGWELSAQTYLDLYQSQISH